MTPEQQKHLAQWLEDSTNYNDVIQAVAFANYKKTPGAPKHITQTTFSRFLAKRGITRKSKRVGDKVKQAYQHRDRRLCPNCNGSGVVFTN